MDIINKERQNALSSIYLDLDSINKSTPQQPQPQTQQIQPQQTQKQLYLPSPSLSSQLTPILNDENTYTYLNNYTLTKQFSEFQDYKKIQTVHFCLYRINNECDTPFIQYILTKNIYSYEFPKKQFICPNIQHKDKNEEISQYIVSFNNFCIESLVDIINIQEELTPYTMKTEYDGFIESDNNNIYVFFNCSSFKNIQLPEYTKWCLIDTILYSQSNTDETKVSKQTNLLFEENTELINILDKYGNPLPLPKELIVCIENNGDYIPENIIQNDNLIKLYSPPIKTELFGNVFIFSAPISPSFFSMFSNTTNFHKCAVFIDKIKYLNGDSIESVDKQIIRDMLKSSENEKYSGICFKYKNNHYYSLKSSKKFTTI